MGAGAAHSLQSQTDKKLGPGVSSWAECVFVQLRFAWVRAALMFVRDCIPLDLRSKHLQAGGRGFEPRLTDPESAVLPLDEPPVKRGHSTTRRAAQSNFGIASRSSIARSIREMTSALPKRCIVSISGGLTGCPVTAMRRIPKR